MVLQVFALQTILVAVDWNYWILEFWPHLEQHSNTLCLLQTKFHPQPLAKSCRGSSCHRRELRTILAGAVQNIFAVNHSSLKCSSYQEKTWEWMDFEIHINEKVREILKNIHILMKKLLISHFTFFFSSISFLSQTWKPGVKKKKSQWFFIPFNLQFIYAIPWPWLVLLSNELISFQFTVVLSEYLPKFFTFFFFLRHHPVQTQPNSVSLMLCDGIQGLHRGRQICKIPTQNVR